MDLNLLTLTPEGLTEEQCARRFLAACAIATTLEEDIGTFLTDWAPCHIQHYADQYRVACLRLDRPGAWVRTCPFACLMKDIRLLDCLEWPKGYCNEHC